MLRLTKPGGEEVRRFLRGQRETPLSYSEAGASRAGSPPGYRTDHNRVRLGEGPVVYARAEAALRSWEMFRIDWLRLYSPDTPIAVGECVATLIRLPLAWSLNACRIVYVLEEDGVVRRFGFAYGTLPGHAERGEERFTVEWRRDDDSVWYDLFAFSRPGSWTTRIGYPLARILQRRFARDSLRAMKRSVSS